MSKFCFDPIVEYGHREFNSLFIEEMSFSNFFQRKANSKNGYFRFHFQSFVNHYNFFRESKKDDCFLIFNNMSLFLLTFVFKDRGVWFVVHNNLDFAVRGRLHRIMYKRIAKKYRLIYLEDRLKKQGEEFFSHKKSIVVRHPKIVINAKDINKDNIFVSGRNLTKEQLIKVCKSNERSNIICNQNFELGYVKNLEMGYIKDFDGMLSTCSKIYIIGNYKYRASGILYKAISIPNIEVVLSDKTYFREVSRNFKEVKCTYEEF